MFFFERPCSSSPAEQDKEGENCGYFVHGLGFEFKILKILRKEQNIIRRSANIDALPGYFGQLGQLFGFFFYIYLAFF